MGHPYKYPCTNPKGQIISTQMTIRDQPSENISSQKVDKRVLGPQKSQSERFTSASTTLRSKVINLKRTKGTGCKSASLEEPGGFRGRKYLLKAIDY